MERKRINGKFAGVGEGKTVVKRPGLVRAPRPAQCRTFVLKRIAEAMPDLTATLIEKAKEGSYQHVSILMRLAGLHTGDKTKDKPKIRRRGNSLMARLVKDLLNGGKVAEKNEATGEKADSLRE